MYFLLADLHARFSYLQQGLAVILAFVGIKMIISKWYHIPTGSSLLVIALVLAVSIVMSLQRTPHDDTIHLVEEPEVETATALASETEIATDGVDESFEGDSEAPPPPQER